MTTWLARYDSKRGDLMRNEHRRAVLKSLVAAGASITLPSSVDGKLRMIEEPITLGIVADTHIGFVDDAPGRFEAFTRAMKEFSPDAVMQLGDFAFPNKKYQAFADAFNDTAKVAIHTIGNHDLDLSLKREDCIQAWGIPSPYYTQHIKGLQIIVLDGNETGSPTHASHGGYPSYIGPKQQEWLSQQLSQSNSPVMIVSHQPLAGRSAIDNAGDLQKIISGHKDKVILCINGHSHVDQQIDIDGIRYLHCNSASYFWLGGDVRLVKYKDPLFIKMTIDPQERRLRIEGVQSQWLDKTPDDAGYFAGKNVNAQKHVVPEIRNRDLGIPWFG